MCKFEIELNDNFIPHLGNVDCEGELGVLTEHEKEEFVLSVAVMCINKVADTFLAMTNKDKEGQKELQSAMDYVKSVMYGNE